MLILGKKLLGTPIISLQTGGRLAVTMKPIINPTNLKIIAYELEGPMLIERPAYIRIADIRELSNVGMIVDSIDEIVGQNDVISLQKICKLNFDLVNLTVFNKSKRKLGKINDFVVDTSSFVIQQLKVKNNFFNSFSQPELLIHRSQIIEINDKSVIVKDSVVKKTTKVQEPTPLTFVNPFRAETPPVEEV